MGAGNSTSHHISSIAHHFFAPDGLWNETSTGGRTRSPAPLHFLTAAPGRGHLAAWAAVRLARASLPAPVADRPLPVGSSVALGDCHRQAWSVRAFLDGQDGEHLRELFRPAAALADLVAGPGNALLPLGGPATGPSGASAPPAGTNWLNLGHCTEEALGRLWQLLHGLESFLGGRLPAADGLVWCVLGADADSSVGAWLLGSLVARLRCRQVKVLLFPADYDLGRCDPTVDEGVRGRHEACRRTLAAALSGTAPEILDVPRPQAGVSDEIWPRLAESLRMGAASRRRAAGERPAILEETA